MCVCGYDDACVFYFLSLVCCGMLELYDDVVFLVSRRRETTFFSTILFQCYILAWGFRKHFNAITIRTITVYTRLTTARLQDDSLDRHINIDYKARFQGKV